MGYLVVEETIEGEETKWSYSKYTADGISEFKSLQKCRKYICGYSQNYLYLNNFEDDTLILDAVMNVLDKGGSKADKLLEDIKYMFDLRFKSKMGIL